jgi:YD repeat-containing protein
MNRLHAIALCLLGASTWVIPGRVLACNGIGPQVGCPLPEYEAPKLPVDVSQLAGNDEISVAPYGGNLVVRATDVSLPSLGGFALHVTRTYQSSRLLLGATGALDPDFGRHRGPMGLGWTYHYGVIWFGLNSQTQSLAYELVTGAGTQELFYLNDSSLSALSSVAGGSATYVSRDLSVLRVDPDNQDRLYVHRADGLRYTYDRLASIMSVGATCAGVIEVQGLAQNSCQRFVPTQIRDLSGNTWTISYDLVVQEYVEHPMMLAITSDDGRQLEFHYATPGPGAAEPVNPRSITDITLDGRVVVDYTSDTVFGHWHLLTSASTPEGRTTSFVYDRSGSGAPDLQVFGLLTGVTGPLGGGTGIVYAQRSFRAPSFYPRQAHVQSVSKLVFDRMGVVHQGGDLAEEYSYLDGASDFRATIDYKTGGIVQATKTIQHHTYPASGCGDVDLVGRVSETRLVARGGTVAEQIAYGDPMEVSARPVHFYCPQTKPKVLRVQQHTVSDSSLAVQGGPSFTITTTPSSYDYLSPKDVAQSNGRSTTASYENVIENDRLSLGLPKTVETKLGTKTLTKSTFTYHTGTSSHLVQKEEVARNSTLVDTFSFTYYASGTGAGGAVKDMRRGVGSNALKTTYAYSFGIVKSVDFPGGSKLTRSGISRHGTFNSESLRGVTTAYKWDDDWRITQFKVDGEEVNINYCSMSQSGCTSNFYCIARGTTCGGTLGSDDGKRQAYFDGLGRRVSEEDWIAGSTKAVKSWSGFDFAHLPMTYTDPVRGTIDLTYDVGGRLVSEVAAPSGPTLTEVVRRYDDNKRSETTTKRGITLYDVDDWAGRPLTRGFQRTGQSRIDIDYAWASDPDGWKSTVTSGAWSGMNVVEVYDFFGRLVSETHPEIGKVSHTYDGRGFMAESQFHGLGYNICNDVNADGQVTQTRKNYSGSCSGGEIIAEASYDPSTTRPISVSRKGGRFSPGLSVTRTYSSPDGAGRDRNLTVSIPRALDAPAPWQGAELFPQAPDAVDAFRAATLAFTTVDEVGASGKYEIEIRALAGARSLAPAYDWGAAQAECEDAGVLTRGPWTSGNVFVGSDLETYIKNADPNWQFDVQPNTLYCWRVRAVKCHDGSACQRAEVSPAGLWGVIAFNNSIARPAGRDGWDQIPTNNNLNVEETYLPCVGMGCPNVAKRGGATVDLTVSRVFNLAGNATSIAYPAADSTLEAWAGSGSALSIARNHLGDPAQLSLTLPGSQGHVLAAYTSFAVDGQPTAGTINTLGYQENFPGAFNVIQTGAGEIGHANIPQAGIGVSWGYDSDGRLTHYSAVRGGDTLYGISNIQYTDDSLVSAWARSDKGLESGSYSAGYDARGQLASYTVGNSGGSGTVTYHYDDNGNLTSRAGQIGLSGLNVYGYQSGLEVVRQSGRMDLGPASFGTFGTNNRSQDPAITYDGEGRIVGDHGLQLVYSHDDRIEAVRGPDGSIERQMLYDGEGNLVRLVEGHQAHYYLRDETGRLLYEEVHDRWFYGSNFRDGQGRVVPNSRRYEHIFMGDSQIATVEHAAGVSSLAYHVRDWRDFEVVSLDADDAFARDYHEPSPYGLETRLAGEGLAASATSLPAPHRLDLGVGGYQHNGWRTVDAWSGRFLRPDPARARHVRFPQGANLYANNLNNPLAYKDRDGDIAFLIPVAIIAYRVWSAAETVNDVITVVDLVTNPNTTTEQLVTAGVAAAAGAVLGKIGGKIVKAGVKRFGNRAFKRVARLLARCKDCKDTCFVAGTPVGTPDGQRGIETLAVGDRVITALGGSSDEVDGSWLRIDLEMANPSESNDMIRISLLRSRAWLDAAGVVGPGDKIFLEFDELGVRGEATVLAIAPGRATLGPGRLVVGTVSHLNDDVYQLSFVGRGETLRPTGRHRLFSVDRNDWVSASKLKVGERLQRVDGVAIVAGVERITGVHRVYNVEVEGDHEYLVGAMGVRAHNTYPNDPSRAPVKTDGGYWVEADPGTLKPKLKSPRTNVQNPANDIPDRFRQTPYQNESGSGYAERVLREAGEFDPRDTGPGSLFNRLKKYADRHFVNP